MSDKVQRLDYIGSKYVLLEWLKGNILQKTGWTSFQGKRVADLFAGTGIVSYTFRSLGASVTTNDRELYSACTAKAMAVCSYTEVCKNLIEQLNIELQTQSAIGYMTTHYSPYESCERMFFTVDNAKKIDYVRQRLEALQASLSDEDHEFLLASLLVSADLVSNTAAVYGCYLKEFKKTAQKPFRLVPVHTSMTPPQVGSKGYQLDVLSEEFQNEINVDLVYLDPPYNERQYSKNYFPLNQLTKDPSWLPNEPPLKGKTGIPEDCFLSPFCKKGKPVEEAFDTLCRTLKTKWIFISYNSESLISKDRMLEVLKKYGTVSVVESEYKRFKSYQYNKDKQIQEYLFCLEKKS